LKRLFDTSDTLSGAKMSWVRASVFLFTLTACFATSHGVDFYTFEVLDWQGNEVSLEKYRGSVSLVVNVASLCGYTDTMYKALKRLQDILGYDNRFQVLAFPCNQFGEQEPYEGEQVYQFAVGNYGVEFPIFSKIEVIGEDAHPAFNYLINESSVHPEWNFYKYLVDPNGKVIKGWTTKATIEEIFDDIKSAVDALPDRVQDDDVQNDDVQNQPEAQQVVEKVDEKTTKDEL